MQKARWSTTVFGFLHLTAVAFDAGIDDGLLIKQPYRSCHVSRQTRKQQKLVYPLPVQWADLLPPTENWPIYRGYADPKLTQVFYLSSLIFRLEIKR